MYFLKKSTKPLQKLSVPSTSKDVLARARWILPTAANIPWNKHKQWNWDNNFFMSLYSCMLFLVVDSFSCFFSYGAIITIGCLFSYLLKHWAYIIQVLDRPYHFLTGGYSVSVIKDYIQALKRDFCLNVGKNCQRSFFTVPNLLISQFMIVVSPCVYASLVKITGILTTSLLVSFSIVLNRCLIF